MKANQLSQTSTNELVMVEQFSVEHWRERFEPLYKRYFELHPNDDLIALSEKLGAEAKEFDGIRGYFKFQNVCQKRASLTLTALAVGLLEKLIPDKR